MRLYDMFDEGFEREQVLVETQYGISCVNTTEDNDDYDLEFSGHLEFKELPESVMDMIQKLRNAGERISDEDVADVYTGKVTTVAGTEDVTVYAFWYFGN